MPKHVYETYIRTTADALWDALNDLETLWAGQLRGDVVEADRPRRMVVQVTFAGPAFDGERPSRVTFEITPVGATCRLTVLHDDFHGVSVAFGTSQRGWPVVLAALKTALEGGGALGVALPAGTPSGDALDTEALDHGAFARAANGRVWGLLENDARTDDDAREMVDAAHASLWHWRYGGELVHEQRGEWLVSRVYAVLGDGTAAMLHARRCLDLTEQGRLDGFDAVYAAEAMARALAASGRDTEAREWRERALVAATKIDDPEDREIVAGDLAVGPWYGIA